MKIFQIYKYISNEKHQLHRFEEDEEFSNFPWRIPYQEEPLKFKDLTGIDLSNLFWIPIDRLHITIYTTDEEIEEMRKSTVWGKPPSSKELSFPAVDIAKQQ